jgi:hypothetical protein
VESLICVSRVRVMMIAWRHSESKHGNSETMRGSRATKSFSRVFVFLSFSAVRYASGTDMRMAPTVNPMDMIVLRMVACTRVQYYSHWKKTKMIHAK